MRRLTLAISAQLLPASRICLRRCSSPGVQGVFVRLFLAGGGAIGAAAASSTFVAGAAAWAGAAATGGAAWGAAGAGVGTGAAAT
jgi:hypothetical protein